MTREEILKLMDARGIAYETTEHEAVYDMEDVRRIPVPYPEGNAKNLFLRDGKKRHYYLLTLQGDRQTDLRAFAATQGLPRLSFASPDELMAVMGLMPGAVTPFGLLNDGENKTRWFLDRGLMGGMIGVHPCDNTATVWLRTDDLTALLEANGHAATVADLPAE